MPILLGREGRKGKRIKIVYALILEKELEGDFEVFFLGGGVDQALQCQGHLTISSV